MELRSRRAWLTLAEPVRTAHGLQRVAEVVQVELRDGAIVAYGESAAVGNAADPAGEALAFLRRPETLEALRAEPPTAGVSLVGGPIAARTALDGAAHDLWGKTARMPVWGLLDAPRTGPPTAWTVSLDSPTAMAAAARSAPVGVRVLKLKLGGRDGQDLARARAVRAATNVPFQVDVNEAWSLEESLELLPDLERLGVVLCEQPLPSGDPGAIELKRRSPVPIYADEECRSAGDVARCAERAHGVNVKLAKCGGIDEARRMIEAARGLRLGVMVGCMGESTLGIAAAAQLAGLCDHVDLDSNLRLARDPWRGLQLREGVQTPGDAPGLGVEPVPRSVPTRVGDAWRAAVHPPLRRGYRLLRQRLG